MKKINLFISLLLLSSQLLLPVTSFADGNDLTISSGAQTTEKSLPNNNNIESTQTIEESLPKNNNIESTQIIEESLPNNNNIESTQTIEESLPNNNNIESTQTSEDFLDSTVINESENDIVTNNDINISAVSEQITSTTEPLSGSVGYSISIQNNSISSYIPAGTTISFKLSSNSSTSINDLLTSKEEYIVNSIDSPNLFVFKNIDNGAINVQTTEDIYPGTKNFDIYFYNPKQQYADSTATLPVEIKGSLLINNPNEQQKYFDISPSTIYISVKKNVNGGEGGITTVPGYNDYGTHNNATKFPSNYLSTRQNGYGLYDGSKKYNNAYVMTFTTAFIKGVQGISNSRGVLWANADHSVPKENFSLILYSATGSSSSWSWTDISDIDGIKWTYTDTGASVDFSQWLSANARFISNGGSISLITAVPVSSLEDTVTYNGSVGWLGYDKWDGPTLKGMFKNPNTGTTKPYFRGSNSITIYNTDTYNPMDNLQAYSETKEISTSIEITDYDGYPIDGIQPIPGIYKINYSVTNDLGENTQFIRKITVLANKQSITGSDYTMHIGDKDATVADFSPSATDKDGNAIDVVADLSTIDFSKAGIYDVVLTATDGQTKTVKLIIKENKQSITGSDYTMHIGDKDATVADFSPSATDKDGNAIDVVADLSTIDFSKAGIYDVVLTATDGQTKTVKLIIKEKKVADLINKKPVNSNNTTTNNTNGKFTGNNTGGKTTNTIASTTAGLPSTGEITSPLLTIIGFMMVLAISSYILTLKRKKSN